MDTDTHRKLFLKAIAVGCHPVWHDGMFGPAWHCGCGDGRHQCDQQCSMITFSSLERKDRRCKSK